LTFLCNNDLNPGVGNPKNFLVKVYGNQTIKELRASIADKLTVTWDQVKLVRYSDLSEIGDTHNGKTISLYGLQDSERLTIQKRPTLKIMRVPLLTEDRKDLTD